MEVVGPIFGKKTVDDITIKIISFIESLGHAPHLGKKVLRLSQYGEIKCVFYKQNHIYYQMFEDRIEIIIVWDGRQDPRRLQNLLIDFLTK